ncbi:hypothetical protein AK830_g8742 [Neonectria ditissima]|uniref:Thioredoxin-like fold domain-containing protein n=1 Tax=Neonectria ditissima TaxID=78410 RepID=A0A0P7BDN3_9HYPO|nr:hypothetical protein AK830_g8742 [Neonectria ditissima]
MSADPSPLTVYRGSATTGAFVWSPFVTKLEARLRFAGIAYNVGAGSPTSAPRGKIPYVELGPAREQLGDSTAIIQRLIHDGAAPDLNAALPPLQRARDLAMRALLEDRGVYFYGTREKWRDNYTAMRDGALAGVPWPLRAPATARIVRSYPVVVEYAERIREKYFPDYERWE